MVIMAKDNYSNNKYFSEYHCWLCGTSDYKGGELPWSSLHCKTIKQKCREYYPVQSDLAFEMDIEKITDEKILSRYVAHISLKYCGYKTWQIQICKDRWNRYVNLHKEHIIRYDNECFYRTCRNPYNLNMTFCEWFSLHYNNPLRTYIESPIKSQRLDQRQQHQRYHL
jgi:hypothetical protein